MLISYSNKALQTRIYRINLLNIDSAQYLWYNRAAENRRGVVIMVREAVKEDLYELLNLSLFLHEKNIPENSSRMENTWNTIIEDENHHIIVNEINGKIEIRGDDF